MSLAICCRSCREPLAGYDLSSDTGYGIYFVPGDSFFALLDDPECWDYSPPEWKCRSLRGYPCFACGTVELSTVDPRLMMKFDGADRPLVAEACPVCAVPCRGYQLLECFDVPGIVTASLGPSDDLAVHGRLCPNCWRAWLSLSLEDPNWLGVLVQCFPDSGACTGCPDGRLRVTVLVAPYEMGNVGLWLVSTT